jgi:hypothetical protein
VLDLAALDVVIGLVFVYFILSLICSAVNEAIASGLGWRGKMLGRAVENLLSGSSQVTEEGHELARHVFKHPLVQGLVRPGSRRWPSYVPSRTFVAALMSLGPAPGTPSSGMRSIEESIAAIPNPQIKDAMLGLLQRTEGDVGRFQATAEEWFDDAMERVSGWYRRRIQIVLAVIAAGFAIFLNADSIMMASGLWADQSVRKAVVAAAGTEAQSTRQQLGIQDVAQSIDGLEQLKIPLGWTTADDATPETKDPRRLVWPWDDVGWFFSKLLGLLITTAALMLGAPFWFDVLSKVARLRATGAPPPTTDSVRKGEGELKRAGSTATAAPEEPQE